MNQKRIVLAAIMFFAAFFVTSAIKSRISFGIDIGPHQYESGPFWSRWRHRPYWPRWGYEPFFGWGNSWWGSNAVIIERGDSDPYSSDPAKDLYKENKKKQRKMLDQIKEIDRRMSRKDKELSKSRRDLSKLNPKQKNFDKKKDEFENKIQVVQEEIKVFNQERKELEQGIKELEGEQTTEKTPLKEGHNQGG